MLSLYGIRIYSQENYSLSLASQKISEPGRFESALFRTFDTTVGRLSEPQEFLDLFKGSPWSFNIGRFNVTDPMGVLITTSAGVGFYRPFLWSLLVFGLATLVLGRVFCGWVCPFHLLLELNDKLRSLLVKLTVVKRDVAFGRAHKYVLLFGLFLISLLTGTHLLTHIYPPLVLSREVFYAAFFNYLSSGFYLLLFIAAFELAISRRWWCRYICPGGALYSLMGRYRVLRIERLAGRCTDCVECDEACPFGLSPMRDMTGMECDNCGLCRSACPEEALIFKWTFSGRDKGKG
jgi:ferredoxin-type protein NapH